MSNHLQFFSDNNPLKYVLSSAKLNTTGVRYGFHNFQNLINSATRRRVDTTILLRVSAPVRKSLIQFRQQPRTHGKQLFFHFRTETLFFGKFVPKNQNYQFKLKFAAQTNSNMQNSMVLFTFSVSDRKYRFLSKFGTKIQNCLFKVNFISSLVRICRIQW